MAKQRTYEEKEAILQKCLELEATGGDILGYLWSQDYLTPRATWCNYQREWLGRKPYQYTDGKPKKKGRLDYMKHAKMTLEHKKKAVEIALAGGDPLKYLKDHGAGNASSMWYTIKETLKDKEPETYAKLPDLRAKGNNRKNPETVVKDGVEYEKAEEPTLADAMTGMQDAADKFFGQFGGTAETPAEDDDDYTVTAILDKQLGEFYYDHDHNSIDWRDGVGDEISLGVTGWKILLKKLPVILRKLGVEL